MPQRLADPIPNAARCGRCAEILPDETLTYCPSCGVPFSKVPPTTSYTRFDERGFSMHVWRKRITAYAVGVATFCALFAFYTAVDAYKAGRMAQHLSADRTVIFHINNRVGYPQLDRKSEREAVVIGLQAFEDHFGSSVPTHFEVSENTLPAPLNDLWRVYPATQLSSWEKKIFPEFQDQWITDPAAPLHVVLTNIPIFLDDPGSTLETRHLSDSKIVSGLAHPGLVVISTFRMLTDKEEYASSRFDVSRPGDKARLLGEYLIAHELGHALLGLTDYVIEKETTPATTLRAPASLSALPSDLAECLMHTDEHGGFAAWESLRKRQLGSASRCREYDRALSAHQNRTKAMALLKDGFPEEAVKIHKLAVDQARQNLPSWLAKKWTFEHDAFLSFGRRWLNRLLMTQSEHD